MATSSSGAIWLWGEAIAAFNHSLAGAEFHDVHFCSHPLPLHRAVQLKGIGQQGFTLLSLALVVGPWPGLMAFSAVSKEPAAWGWADCGIWGASLFGGLTAGRNMETAISPARGAVTTCDNRLTPASNTWTPRPSPRLAWSAACFRQAPAAYAVSRWNDRLKGAGLGHRICPLSLFCIGAVSAAFH